MKRYLFLAAIFAVMGCSPSANISASANPLADAAQDRLSIQVRYDPAYVRLDYPGGDVPKNTGVSTDVIIRSLRTAYKIDLQKNVHEDMKANFSVYPKIWGLKRPDKNIDHRRVPILETYLSRSGYNQPMSKSAKDYLPGDIVSWRLGGRLSHIGIVSERKSASGTPLIIHNIGAGVAEDDILFASMITGHFRISAPEN